VDLTLPTTPSDRDTCTFVFGGTTITTGIVVHDVRITGSGGQNILGQPVNPVNTAYAGDCIIYIYSIVTNQWSIYSHSQKYPVVCSCGSRLALTGNTTSICTDVKALTTVAGFELYKVDVFLNVTATVAGVIRINVLFTDNNLTIQTIVATTAGAGLNNLFFGSILIPVVAASTIQVNAALVSGTATFDAGASISLIPAQ
jgi:hypothetical protein